MVIRKMFLGLLFSAALPLGAQQNQFIWIKTSLLKNGWKMLLKKADAERENSDGACAK